MRRTVIALLLLVSGAVTAVAQPARQYPSGQAPQRRLCAIGVAVSRLGDKFNVEQYDWIIGIREDVSVESWHLGDFVVDRMRAAFGNRGAVQRIPVRKEEIAPFEGNPGLGEVLLPLTDRVRALAAGTRCARYVVVTRGIEPEFPHVGLGIESPQEIFPLARPYVYAYMTARVYDGETFAQLGAIMDQSAIHTVDESLWPDPPNNAAQNARLREAIRELVAQRLDKMLTELRRAF